MKRLITILASIAVMMFAYYSLADQVSSKQSMKQEITKVSDVMSLNTGSKIWLKGNLVRLLDKEHYILKDDTGEIKVKISKSLLKVKEIQPQQTVKIFGEIKQNDYLSAKRHIPPEIKVKKIEILKDSDLETEDNSLICVDTNRK